MITDWIYNSPTWLWGTVLVCFFSALAALGLIVFDRVVHVELRRAHNELAGFLVAVISVTYAVLLAFIAVATWESYSHAQDIVDAEADYVGSVYRDTQGLPRDMGRPIRQDLREYVATVVNQEWPTQRAGKTPAQAWDPLRRLHASIVTMQPQTMGEEIIQAELLRTLNELYTARANRLSEAQGHIPEVVWWIIFLGGGLTTGFTYLFGFHDLRMHVVMTVAVAASLSLVVVLIVALDWPFRGEVSISPEAYLKTEESWGPLPFINNTPEEPSSPPQAQQGH